MSHRWTPVMTAVLATACCLAAWAPARGQSPASTSAPEITAPIDGQYGPDLIPRIPTTLVSATGGQVDRIIHILHLFMAVLFVGWGIFFVYCLVHFRQRPGHRAVATPVKAKFSKWAEVGVALFEGALLIGLAIPVWAEVKTGFPSEDERPQHVRVMAEQFAWNFHYPGPDGKFGKLSIDQIDLAVNPLGIDPSDPHGKDDIVGAELHIVKDRPVIAELTSKDVIHSFFIPVMRVKQDVIPGMRIPVWFQAVASGNYEIACAQLCGNNHYSMKALLVIHESQSQLDEWFEEQAPEEFDEDEFD
ncbi:MAG: cytochrome c oxidase subunit II [Phycisphaerae bacterium]